MHAKPSAQPFRILLVDDDRIVRVTVRDALADAGYDVTECADGSAAAKLMGDMPFDLLLSDVRLPGEDGIALFRRFAQAQPGSAAILMTAFGKVEDAVGAIREGASDYITKPFELDALVLRVQRVHQEVIFKRATETHGSPGEKGRPPLHQEICGRSAPVVRVLDLIDAAAGSDASVLVTGETGTGKELCARMIHHQSGRAAGPFVAVNCAAIPENLVESELFGFERGAFTGADRKRKGSFVIADGGILFLDEIGSLSAAAQAKLLRAVDSRTVDPVGADKPVSVDARIVSATNEDLDAAVMRGDFREDLYYRIKVISIKVPSLRERAADIPTLVGHLLRGIADRQGVEPPPLGSRAFAALCTYEYPGNVRELIHALEHAFALARSGPIRLRHLPESIAGAIDTLECGQGEVEKDAVRPQPLGRAVKRFEQEYIRRVLSSVDGNRTKAAELLGISRKSLWEKLKTEDR